MTIKKSIACAAFLLTGIISTYGQLPKWAITPQYDKLYFKTAGVLQGEGDNKNSLWTVEGKQLFTTGDLINSYNNGLATIQRTNPDRITGFVDAGGYFIPLPDTKIAFDYPYFEDGYLVGVKGDSYVLYDKEGTEITLPELETLYPYSHEHAVYMAYQQPEKKKNPYFNQLMPNGKPVVNLVMKENDKTKIIEPKEISFMSAVDNGSGKALTVIKNKLYWFDTFEMCLVPITMEDDKGKPKQLVLDNSKELSTMTFPSDSVVIKGKYGKDLTYDFKFDRMLRLVPNRASASSANKKTITYEVPYMASDLTATSEGGKTGLAVNGRNCVPDQFDNVGKVFGNHAMIMRDGKWGLIEIIPACDYTLTVNGGDSILFSHRLSRGTFRIDLPKAIEAEKVAIEIPSASGLRLDETSRKNKNSDEGNTISFNCTLSIPANLPDTITDISYGNAILSVDGIKLSAREIKTRGRHVNHYKIDVSNQAPTVAKGKAVFDLLIYSTQESDFRDFPFEVTLDTDTLPSMVEMISEKLYRCTVDNLKPGVTDFQVKVTEQDCPASVFPMAIDYSVNKKVEKVAVSLKGDNDEAVFDNQAPRNVTYDGGYIAGEVIADDAVLRSGPGVTFPKSTFTQIFMGPNGETTETMEYAAPMKGERLKVKEEGDWYLIFDVPSEQSKKDARYIAKRYIKPVESKPFITKEITEPTAYVRLERQTDEEGEVGYFPEVVVIYPGGLFVVYAESFWDSALSIGEFSNGDAGLKTQYSFGASYSTDIPKGSKHGIKTFGGEGDMGVGFEIYMPTTEVKHIMNGQNKIAFPNLSKFSEAEWREAIAKLKVNPAFTDGEFYYNDKTDSEARFVTNDELSKKYTKVN